MRWFKSTLTLNPPSSSKVTGQLWVEVRPLGSGAWLWRVNEEQLNFPVTVAEGEAPDRESAVTVGEAVAENTRLIRPAGPWELA